MATFITLECQHCRNSFSRPAWEHRTRIKKGVKAIFCSKDCKIGNDRLPQTDFWACVDVLGPDECWPWKRGTSVKGYGVFEEATKSIFAHRRAFEKKNGPLPPGKPGVDVVVRHKCDNRICCNPAHLRLGTQLDNMEDMVKRGRMARKVTDDDVRAIRSDTRPYTEISEQYGINLSSISAIKNHKAYKYVL